MEKFFFGDRVTVPSGQQGTVTEIDGQTGEYCVVGVEFLGWFESSELKEIL